MITSYDTHINLNTFTCPASHLTLREYAKYGFASISAVMLEMRRNIYYSRP